MEVKTFTAYRVVRSSLRGMREFELKSHTEARLFPFSLHQSVERAKATALSRHLDNYYSDYDSVFTKDMLEKRLNR